MRTQETLGSQKVHIEEAERNRNGNEEKNQTVIEMLRTYGPVITLRHIFKTHLIGDLFNFPDL